MVHHFRKLRQIPELRNNIGNGSCFKHPLLKTFLIFVLLTNIQKIFFLNIKILLVLVFFKEALQGYNPNDASCFVCDRLSLGSVACVHNILQQLTQVIIQVFHSCHKHFQ